MRHPTAKTRPQSAKPDTARALFCVTVTMLALAGLSGCAPTSGSLVTVTSVSDDGRVCVYDDYFGGQRCTLASDFNPVGGVIVGDCLKVSMMKPTHEVTEVERATECPPVRQTSPPGTTGSQEAAYFDRPSSM